MSWQAQLPSGVSFFERGWLSSNNVLLFDPDHAILVDTGYCSHAIQTAKLVRAILGVRPLDEIVNTHLHSDHCGGNAYLQSIYPHARTSIPPGNYDAVTHWDPEVLSYTPTGQECPQFVVQRSLQTGDCFAAAGLEWRVYASPGHDPHSIILFCHTEGILISADALWERGFGVVFPEIEGISAFDEVESTIDLIESLKPRVVLPGHGPAFSDVSNAISYSRTRLDGFRNNPLKHAIYASKVLLKFKLLELQAVDINHICAWAIGCSYFHALHSYFPQQPIMDWILEMCDSLVESGAATRVDNLLMNR